MPTTYRFVGGPQDGRTLIGRSNAAGHRDAEGRSISSTQALSLIRKSSQDAPLYLRYYGAEYTWWPLLRARWDAERAARTAVSSYRPEAKASPCWVRAAGIWVMEDE